MPSRDAHLQFEKWAREYGPVYSLILGTKTLVVLSSDQAVKDLLDKKSSIYSHRQEMYIGQTLCSGDLRLLMMVSFLKSCSDNRLLTMARDMDRNGVGYD
jgi:hypothetical protein